MFFAFAAAGALPSELEDVAAVALPSELEDVAAGALPSESEDIASESDSELCWAD